MRINIRTRGDISFLRRLPQHFESIKAYTGLELQQLAQRCADKMVENINNQRKRPKNYPGESNLSMAIRGSIRIIQDAKSFRVLFIDYKELYSQAPYWYILNYGGSPWGGTAFFGSFEGEPPRSEGGKQPWSEYGSAPGQGTFMMKPKKPIEGIHYIEKGIHWLRSQWNKVLRDADKYVKYTAYQLKSETGPLRELVGTRAKLEVGTPSRILLSNKIKRLQAGPIRLKKYFDVPKTSPSDVRVRLGRRRY